MDVPDAPCEVEQHHSSDRSPGKDHRQIGTASSDLSARLWSLGGSLNRVLVAHKPDAAIVQAAIDGARALYGQPMVKPTEEYAGRQGAWLGTRLGIPGVQTGVGPPGFRGHATDEFVTVEHYVKGVKFAATILDNYAAHR